MKRILRIILVTIVALSIFIGTASATTYCTGDGVRVRSTPKNADNIIGKLHYGDVVDVLAEKGGWAKIRYGNGVGYVYAGFLQESGNESSSQTLGLTLQDTKMKTSLTGEGKTVTIPKYTIVWVLATQNGVAAIKYYGQDGFVRTSDLQIKSSDTLTCVGVYTLTFHQNDESRSRNISQAIQRLNGTKVKSGQTFSFFKTIGIDYELATEYGEDDVTLGGGLCHISTALKMAVNCAQHNGCNIKINVLHRFDEKTPYAKRGEEAKVSIDERKDFQFKNKNSFALKIYALQREDSIIILICK